MTRLTCFHLAETPGESADVALRDLVPQPLAIALLERRRREELSHQSLGLTTRNGAGDVMCFEPQYTTRGVQLLFATGTV